ncbi:MAG TPA: hypothetical protein PLY93_02585 [Turneriella sp.]|nr:hypothetical protein [Turneriella sp.]
MRHFFIATLALLPFLTGCILTEKRATIRITDASGYADMCVKIEGRQKTEAQSLPYTYTAEEGETVSLKAFISTNSTVIATGSITTRMTNDCENEVIYYAEIRNGYFNITDDYVPVSDCKSTSK